MTAVIASLVYDADVVRRGRRRESRETFRHDVPVEIREIERSSLTPAVRIDDGKDVYVFEGDGDGFLWRPFVPKSRRPTSTRGENILPGAHAESVAQTVAEFVQVVTDVHPPGQDPLERRHYGVDFRRMNHLPFNERMVRADASHARRLPRIEDSDVRTTLWSERSRSEQRLREATERLRIVEGKVWIRQPEPVLALVRRREARRLEVHPAGPLYNATLTAFRLDRFDEIIAWAASRHGFAVVPPVKGAGSNEPVIEHRYELLRPEICRRDDAREILAAKAHFILSVAHRMLATLPVRGVDAYVDLKRFVDDPVSCGLSTPALFGRLETLREAAASLAGLGEDGFAAQGKLRQAISRVQGRWNFTESHRYPVAELSDSPAASISAA